jgi:hypothetical protein
VNGGRGRDVAIAAGDSRTSGSTTKKIFREKPHSTWDNYFSGDMILNWLGENGFSSTMTCRRDRLPAEIPGHFLHKGKQHQPL